MVMTVISELKKAKKGDAILFKKLFVLIGLLCKENRSNTSGSNTLEDLLSTDEIIPFNADRKMVEDPWKGTSQALLVRSDLWATQERRPITFYCSRRDTCTRVILTWP